MLLVFLLLITATKAMQHCEHILSLESGQLRRLPSPNYPDVDGPTTRCQWTVIGPDGTGIAFVCPFINRPTAPSSNTTEKLPCQGRFEIEPEGEKTPPFCTDRAFSQTVSSNRMVIKYSVQENIFVDSFVCFLYAESEKSGDTGETHFRPIVSGPIELPAKTEGETEIQSFVNKEVELPCNLTQGTDLVTVVIWYRSDNAVPFYTLDARGSSLDTGKHWVDERAFGGRASMRVANGVAYLLLQSVREEDAGRYRCRVDFKKSPTQNSVVVLNLGGDPKVPSVYDGCDSIIHVKYGETVQLKSFKYPNLQPPGRNCRWTVDSPVGTKVQLSCPRLSKSASQEDPCRYFSMYKTGVTDHKNAEFHCRNEKNYENSEDNFMVITFSNDHNIIDPFICNLTASCDQTVHLDFSYHHKGVRIKSPSYPSTLPPGETCRWTVESTSGTRIVTSCPNFDHLNYGDGCHGWFEISPANSSESVTTFCRDEGFTHYSVSNKTILQFKTGNDSRPHMPFACTLQVERIRDNEVMGPNVKADVNGVAKLPCIITKGSDPVTIIWYRDETDVPVYSFDVRNGTFENATHWVGVQFSGGRASLLIENGIAKLVINPAQHVDTGRYRCRVDFKKSPTFNWINILTVGEVGPELPSVYEGCDNMLYLNYGQPVEITSLQYPNLHPANRPCRWILDAPLDAGINASCTTPQKYQNEERCDMISFYKPSAKAEFSDTQPHCISSNFSDYSWSNEMIVMYTEGTLPFSCTLTLQCDKTIYLENYQKGLKIKSPNYPLMIPPGTSCHYTLVSPHRSKILISCPNTKYPKEEPCRSWFEVSPTGKKNSSFSICRHEGFAQYSDKNSAFLKYNTNDTIKPTQPFLCYLTMEPADRDGPGWGDDECHCGRRNTARIIGGQTTRLNEYPMMASLMELGQGQHICGATIISYLFALTSAYCIQFKIPSQIGLTVGEHDLADPFETTSTEIYGIVKIIKYPKWAQNWNDIALVRVKDSITFDKNVGPVCLPFSNRDMNFIAEDVFALGWGKTNDSTKGERLQQIDLLVMDKEQCSDWFPAQSKFLNFYQKNLCTFSLGKKICHLDAGGPILWLDPLTFKLKLVGVQSSEGCERDDMGNAHARVTHFLDWIVENTEGAAFCKK